MNRFRLFAVLFLIIFMSSCSGQNQEYNYNNVTSEQGIGELKELLSNADVPAEDIDNIIYFIAIYSKGDYAINHLRGDWAKATITKDIYNYTTAIDLFTNNEFEDLNCRRAALIIFNSFITTTTTLIETENIKEEYQFYGGYKYESEYLKYAALFASFPLDESVADSVKNNWRSKDVVFTGDKIQLVSLWGKTKTEIENIHCGILINNDENIYFFEKTDPILPYQLSIFQSTDDLKKYLLSRTNEFNDMTVFVDNEAL